MVASRQYGPLLDALRGVRWPARRAVGAALPGAHRSRQRGTSGEFTEYRLYRQGDDPRQLDWKLLARSDRAFVRLTDDRALLPTWFVLDGSASMAFPSNTNGDDTRLSKWQLACNLVVGLASVAHSSGDPVGLVAVGAEGPVKQAARTRRGAVGDIARAIDMLAVGGDGAMAPLLATLPLMARVVIVSDLLGDLDALVRAAGQRTVAGGQVECVHVVATDELTPPVGAFLARDPEVMSMQRPLDRAAADAYSARFAAFRADVAQRWRASGSGYTEVRTDANVARVVRQIVGGAGRVSSGIAGAPMTPHTERA